jgi:hypothetical protein
MYNNAWGYNNPYLTNQYGQQALQPQGIKSEVVRVNGQNGANAYQLASNSSILLLDETAPIIWLKTTDGAGYATVTPYKIEPYTPEPTIDIKSLEGRISKLEEMINNAKSDVNSNAERNDRADKKYNERCEISTKSSGGYAGYGEAKPTTTAGV